MTPVQHLYEIDLRVQNGSLEVICEKQVAATADMKHGSGKFLKIYVHQVRYRIIFHETAGLHLHSEGVHLRKVLIIICLYHIEQIPDRAGDDE